MHSSKLVEQVPRAALSAMQHTSPSSQSLLAWQLSPSTRLHAHNKQAAAKHHTTEVRIRANSKQSSMAARRIRAQSRAAKLLVVSAATALQRRSHGYAQRNPTSARAASSAIGARARARSA